MTKLNFLIRGHVRNSFKDDNLYNLLKKITEQFDTNIYIHTWDVVQTDKSWRLILDDPTPVTEDFIKLYFRDTWESVKKLIIENENSVTLHGNTIGNIGSTPCPVKSYKSMFYGKLKVAEYVFNNAPNEQLAVQTRFDVLSNSFSANPDSIMLFLNSPKKDSIEFISKEATPGIENIYSASVCNMYKFIKYFYFNFDSIYNEYNSIKHQEYPVFFESSIFFQKIKKYKILF